MASNLSRATSSARKGIIVFLIFAISTFIFRFIFGIIEEEPIMGTRVTPTPDSPYLQVNQALGKIPRPEISALPLTPGSAPRYSLQDRDTLPNFPPVANVYVINKPREKLGSTNKGREVAGRLEFLSPERITADNTLFWQSTDTARSLTYHKVLEDWLYSTDLTKETLPEQDRAGLAIDTSPGFYANKGISMISAVGLSNGYFNNSSSFVSYINYNPRTNTYSSVATPAPNNFVRIAQYKRVEAAPVRENYRPQTGQIAAQTVYANVRKINYLDGVFNLIVRGKAENTVPDIVSFDFLQLNYGERGIYKLMSPEEAFIKIQNAEGLIYWVKLENSEIFAEHVPLNILEFQLSGPRTSLIYIEPDNFDETKLWTNFLQPYYLFEGTAILTDGREADFAIILEALVDSEYQ